jgi:hypothetical protein
VQAARLLESMVDYSYDYVAPGDPRYQKVADAWKEAGNLDSRNYWEARARYLEAYWRHLPRGSVAKLNEIWGDTLRIAGSLSILRKLDPQDLERTALDDYFLDSFLYWGEPLPEETRKWAGELSPKDRLGLLLASGDLSLSAGGKIGDTDLSIAFPIEVHSSGGRFKKGARVRVDGKTAFESDGSKAAVCAVVIAPDIGRIEKSQTFATSSDPSEWGRMVSWAKAIPEGRIVAVAIATTAAPVEDEIDQIALREFLGEFGIRLPERYPATKKLIVDQAFAGLGVKGARTGTGQRVLGGYVCDQAVILVLPRPK